MNWTEYYLTYMWLGAFLTSIFATISIEVMLEMIFSVPDPTRHDTQDARDRGKSGSFPVVAIRMLFVACVVSPIVVYVFYELGWLDKLKT